MRREFPFRRRTFGREERLRQAEPGQFPVTLRTRGAIVALGQWELLPETMLLPESRHSRESLAGPTALARESSPWR